MNILTAAQRRSVLALGRAGAFKPGDGLDASLLQAQTGAVLVRKGLADRMVTRVNDNTSSRTTYSLTAAGRQRYELEEEHA